MTDKNLLRRPKLRNYSAIVNETEAVIKEISNEFDLAIKKVRNLLKESSCT
jgi:hypothetical protein